MIYRQPSVLNLHQSGKSKNLNLKYFNDMQNLNRAYRPVFNLKKQYSSNKIASNSAQHPHKFHTARFINRINIHAQQPPIRRAIASGYLDT